jgi:hypothetical protein
MLPLPTRALSLTWPWPHFMFSLPEPLRKKIENRKPGFSHKSFRGDCWVQLTPCKTERDFDYACQFALWHGVPAELMPARRSGFEGHIIGRWSVVDLLPPPGPIELPDRWRMDGQFGFVVENARMVPPVKCKGALGFWSVPADVPAQLTAAAA